MSGKTSLGKLLAIRLGLFLISVDDLTAAMRGATNAFTHPELHFMSALDYREYYVQHPPEKLIDDFGIEHATVWEGVRPVALAHATWSSPALIEGWQLHPEKVAGISLANVKSLWLIPDRETLEKRIRADVDFYRGASSEETMIRHYLERSIYQASLLEIAARQFKMPILKIQSGDSLQDIESAAYALLGIE
jgi:2-phosphoglycerate kinase